MAHALKKSAAKAVSERWSKSTATNYDYALQRLGRLAERPVALITDDEIHEARDSLLESYSANTARVSFNCLRKTWKWDTSGSGAPDRGLGSPPFLGRPLRSARWGRRAEAGARLAGGLRGWALVPVLRVPCLHGHSRGRSPEAAPGGSRP